MFGYVRPSQPKMTEDDRKRFSAVYCGLCRTLGERYGTAVRFILNYDFTFLAMLLSQPEEPEQRHGVCMAHPIRGRDYYPASEALALAADCSVILAYWQIQDAIRDHRGVKTLKYRAATSALKGAYSKAREIRPNFDRSVETHLMDLDRLERDHCASLDQAADTFALLLQGIADEVDDPVKSRVLAQLFYHLGRWIYLIDAADDLTKDFADGSYNPLIYRFGLEKGELTEEAKQELVLSLDHSIRLMAAAFELWDFGVWDPIIQSTIYEGLFCVGKAVLEGTFQAGKKALRQSGRDEEQV